MAEKARDSESQEDPRKTQFLVLILYFSTFHLLLCNIFMGEKDQEYNIAWIQKKNKLEQQTRDFFQFAGITSSLR